MNKALFPAFLGALCLTLLFSATLAHAELAVVDTERVLRESQPGKDGEVHLQKVRDVLQKGMDDLQALYKGKEKSTDAQKAMTEGYMALERQMGAERQAVLNILGQNLTEAVRQWRLANTKYTAVISRQALLDSDKSLDVTSAILLEMNKQKPQFPPLPTVTLNTPKGQTKEKKDTKDTKEKR